MFAEPYFSLYKGPRGCFLYAKLVVWKDVKINKYSCYGSHAITVKFPPKCPAIMISSWNILFKIKMTLSMVSMVTISRVNCIS